MLCTSTNNKIDCFEVINVNFEYIIVTLYIVTSSCRIDLTFGNFFA